MARYGFAFFDSGARWDSPDAHPTNMRDLITFLENPFDDPKIKYARLLAFSTDHLQAMIARNESHELDGRIAALTSALTLVGECATDDETKKGLRKARKQAKDAFRAGLPPRIAKLAAAVTAKWGEDSEQWTECFPQGRTIFSTSTDDSLGMHIGQLKDAMSEYAAQLGAEVIADVTAVQTGWTTVYNKSEESEAKKDASLADKKAARENLQLMLFLDLLKLAEMFARQPEKLALYMKQSLLEAPSHEEEPPPPTPPTP
jgi:hypothetical protein